MEPPTYFPLHPPAVLPSESVSVSVSSPRRLRDAGRAELLNTRTVARPPSSRDGKWTWTFFENDEANKGVQGAELAL